jgi:hypothetical protein
MGSTAERLERASEIVAIKDINLSYMIDDPLDPSEDEPIGRYMLVTHTDDSCDRGDTWLEFVDTLSEVLQKIGHLIVDEWGYGGCWDLDANSYLDPLKIQVEVSIETTHTAAPVRHSLVA